MVSLLVSLKPFETLDAHMTDTTGTWDAGGICAEFCGLDHHKMVFDLRIVTPEGFDQWIAEQGGTP